MVGYPIKLAPDFSDGVDRKLLKQVRDRFLKVNSERLRRALQGLSLRHQDLLTVLPLLYHINHPMMPGYVARDVPVGVSGWVPDKIVLSIAKSFSQSFKYQSEGRHQAQIHALFMMGSTGTLAHSETSDVDLWLCVDPTLTAEQLSLVHLKAAAVDVWANRQGLELHTFVMKAERFRADSAVPAMDAESSGSAQHFLLLDEFYRTAILLAGRYPLWWLIPPAQEQHYQELTELLLAKRFVKATEVLDFGSAADIPKGELIGAGLWQLYKGLDAPYKSVLKLLLIEVYAQELPYRVSLSQTFKQAVYDDQLRIEDLDPYFLIYQRLEAYLMERQEHKRLDLVRKSFYLKVAKKLSKKPSGRTASWQRLTLQTIVKAWAWPESKFKYLDARLSWKVDQVLIERQEVVAELTYCYRFLANYARANNIASSITAEDLNLLGRKLYAIFQRKAGKVERVNPGIAPGLWEENLALHHSSTQPYQVDKDCWLLYRDLAVASDAAFQIPLKKTSCLIELLAWLHFNGIVSHATRLSLVAGQVKLTLLEVQSMIQAFEQMIPAPLALVTQHCYQQRAAIEKLLLFINVGVDPLEAMSERGLHRLSNWTDSLGYSAQRHNLVKTIDQVTFNSWHEMSAHRYEMGETLMQNLQSYLQICLEQLEGTTCELKVCCFGSQRADAIAHRVSALFEDAKRAFFVGGKVQLARYVIEVEEQFYVLSRVDEQFRVIAFATEERLFEYLSQSAQERSPVILDPYALLKEQQLRFVLAKQQAQRIQVFYLAEGRSLVVTVLDEMGSLLRFTLADADESLFQSSIWQFLCAILEKRQLSESMAGQQLQFAIDIYQLRSTAPGQYEAHKIAKIPSHMAHAIQVTGFYDGPELYFDVCFDQKDFTYLEYGEHQLEALVHYLKSNADLDQRLPVRVTDISLPDDPLGTRLQREGTHRTLEYVRMYHRIMSRLIYLLG